VKTRCRVRLVTDAIQGWRERYVIWQYRITSIIYRTFVPYTYRVSGRSHSIKCLILLLPVRLYFSLYVYYCCAAAPTPTLDGLIHYYCTSVIIIIIMKRLHERSNTSNVFGSRYRRSRWREPPRFIVFDVGGIDYKT
jgi:hypothetical protein